MQRMNLAGHLCTGQPQLGRTEVAEFLVAEGAEFRPRRTTKHGIASGGTAGELRLVELLISKGADIDAKDKGGNAPLHSAAATGRREVAELLIAKGADVNAKTTPTERRSTTPLGATRE